MINNYFVVPMTILCPNNDRAQSVYDRICTSRPVNNKYKNGWLRRLNAITLQP